MKDLNKFIWYTTDGKMHEKTVTDEEERANFMYWLETDKTVVKWY
jgi:hypothetical protein